MKGNDKGQTLVEFALVLLPLLLILLGIIEFGWLLNGHITITSAAREGARAAAVGGDAAVAVDRHITGSALSNVTATTSTEGNDVVVSVNGHIQPLVNFYVAGPFNLNAKATMRKEQD
ncbi:MAG: hypothetical protein D5R97_09185 [Candidatus Syntrophonatronum acetioxidans]|uniref:TadE-like domain-containing protein n=1 Tax=Candidatus Syntrophonatronum acetioxidans TaxID=1795816 RepID=A0A424YB68_9FIRM|nr:MAG: hypothetical protein D5R97_09185 [Candidatus Syntrophonatronum acetioxidans]